MVKAKTLESPAKRPLRVLMIAPTSFFSDYGGHIRILEETRALQNLGQQVAIVTYYKGSDMPGLDIRRTAPLPWNTDYEVGSSRHKIAFDIYLAVQSLIEALRFRPDVIHGHMHEGALIGGLLSRLLRVPMVFDFQGSLTGEMVDHGFLNPEGRIYRWAYRLERFISRRLAHAVLTSSLQAGTLLRDEFGVRSEAIHPLPDCADIIRFDQGKFAPEQKLALKKQLGIPLDRPIIAYLGLLTDYQGVHHLVESAALLKEAGAECHFLVMGYPSVERYREMALHLGVADSVTFTGKVEYRDAPLYLSLGDISLAPKISATEGSGKVLNYMALAQPVVAYDTPVHREYLDDLGCYVPAGDVGAFAEAILTLINDPEKRRQLGEQLRARATEEYSWGRAGERILELYRRLTI